VLEPNGEITGTPVKTGTSSFTVTVTVSSTPIAQSASAAFKIVVVDRH
jgi:hypothetical protein